MLSPVFYILVINISYVKVNQIIINQKLYSYIFLAFNIKRENIIPLHIITTLL